jgi:cysteine synthase
VSSILDHIGGTPLVQLRRLAKGLPNPVWVKCEHLNPSGSVKDRAALFIVEDARARGVLQDGATLIEATAGNTGLGLALACATYGYQLACTMPEKMSPDKRVALKAQGVEVIITPNAPPSDPRNFQRVAERLADERGWFLTDQFRNPANVRAHETGTAVEIWEQTDGKVGAFVAGSGTGGTITGVGRFLKQRGSPARVVLADPVGSALAEWIDTGSLGPDGTYAIEGIGASEPPEILDRDVIDSAERISDEESFRITRRLIGEEGLLVGGSAGTAVAAALRVAAGPKLDGPVVALLPDSWDRYFAQSWLRG